MNGSLKKQFSQLYQAPPPQRRDEFLKNLNYPKTTWLEFVRTQAGYIRKRAWAASVLLLAAAVLAGKYENVWDAPEGMLWSVSAVMPVLALILILETFRSEVYGMVELELASRHNLASVLLVRMGIMAASDLLLVLAALPAVSGHSTFGYLRSAVYLLVPYLMTCVCTLVIQKYRKGRESLIYSVISAFLVCGINILLSGIQEFWYSGRNFFFWLTALAVLLLMTGKEAVVMRNQLKAGMTELYLAE